MVDQYDIDEIGTAMAQQSVRLNSSRLRERGRRPYLFGPRHSISVSASTKTTAGGTNGRARILPADVQIGETNPYS